MACTDLYLHVSGNTIVDIYEKHKKILEVMCDNRHSEVDDLGLDRVPATPSTMHATSF